jgi:hypothetical protein
MEVEVMVPACSAVSVLDVTSLLKVLQPMTLIVTIGRIRLLMVTRLADFPQAVQRPDDHKPQRPALVKVAAHSSFSLVGMKRDIISYKL